MTNGEARVYDYIVTYRKRHGLSPSIREISTGLGLFSTYSVQRHIASLVEAGYLQNAAGMPRSLVPTCDIPAQETV